MAPTTAPPRQSLAGSPTGLEPGVAGAFQGDTAAMLRSSAAPRPRTSAGFGRHCQRRSRHLSDYRQPQCRRWLYRRGQRHGSRRRRQRCSTDAASLSRTYGSANPTLWWHHHLASSIATPWPRRPRARWSLRVRRPRPAGLATMRSPARALGGQLCLRAKPGERHGTDGINTATLDLCGQCCVAHLWRGKSRLQWHHHRLRQ